MVMEICAKTPLTNPFRIKKTCVDTAIKKRWQGPPVRTSLPPFPMSASLQVLTKHAPDELQEAFARDVQRGLGTEFKYIPSTHLYNEKGSLIFQEIMDMPEYYLADCETEILQKHKEEILSYVEGRPFRLIELGAGDGRKTRILLDFFQEADSDFEYIPIDISQEAMQGLLQNLGENFPTLRTKALVCNYEQGLKALEKDDVLNFVLFLGSSLGNFSLEQTYGFCKQVNSRLSPGDLFLAGMDLAKDPDILLQAYSDSTGITKRFNLNLLERINDDLNSSFNTELFHHHVIYNPIDKIVKTYLLSQEKHSVRIGKLGQEFFFEAWEAIHTENSSKYNFKDIEKIAKQSNFHVLGSFTDSRNYFADTIWKVSE